MIDIIYRCRNPTCSQSKYIIFAHVPARSTSSLFHLTPRQRDGISPHQSAIFILTYSIELMIQLLDKTVIVDNKRISDSPELLEMPFAIRFQRFISYTVRQHVPAKKVEISGYEIRNCLPRLKSRLYLLYQKLCRNGFRIILSS